MPMSLGGTWQNQNQQGGEQSSRTYQDTTTQQAIAPEGWEEAWRGMNPGDGSPTTKWAENYFQSRTSPGEAGSSHTLATLADLYPDQYKELADVSAQNISAKRGLEFMDDYKNEYLQDVLDSSLQDYDYGVGGAANAFRLGQIGGGGGGSRGTVANAEMAGQAARGRGALSSGIRSDAFNTALGAGFQDAGNALTAAQSNQMANLQAAIQNQNMQNQRQMFDVESAYRGDMMRDNAALTAAGLSGDRFAQGLQYLNAGTPLFGQQQDSSGSEQGNRDFWSQMRGSGKSAGLGK